MNNDNKRSAGGFGLVGDIGGTNARFALWRGQRLESIEVLACADYPVINLPAIGYNFSDEQPVAWVDASFHESGVAMTLRTVAGNQNNNGKTTEVSWA